MNHEIDHCNENHTFTAARQFLVIFGEPAILAEPTECAFDDPAFGQHHEFSNRLLMNNLNDAAVPAARPVHELARIAAVRPDDFQSPPLPTQLLDQKLPAIAILDVGCMHHQNDDQPERVHNHMTFAATHLLPRVEAAIPPFPAVLIDWLSMMPALGVGLRPAFRRTRSRRRS